jgi:hypothetical protein
MSCLNAEMKSFAVLLSCVAAALALPGDERQGHLRAENGAQAAARFRATLGVSADYKGCIIQIGALAENRYVLQQGECATRSTSSVSRCIVPVLKRRHSDCRLSA